VVGGEATGFTPWLSTHLEVVGTVLGLEDVELVSTEVDVAGKRLDILAAVADDADARLVWRARPNTAPRTTTISESS
jgi:hypothetical protein